MSHNNSLERTPDLGPGVSFGRDLGSTATKRSSRWRRFSHVHKDSAASPISYLAFRFAFVPRRATGASN
jgi:hypothetical protein